MIRPPRRCRLARAAMLAAALGACLAARTAGAQLGSLMPSSRFELAETVQIDRVDSTSLGQLERVKAYLADGQWQEAVDALRQVAESAEGKLIGLTPWRYVPLGDYCQIRLAALPEPALRIYRAQVDPLARKWYDEGVAARDAGVLRDLVEQAGASRWGDDALLALGEMALESGNYADARWYWERILPAGLPPEATLAWPGFPDSDLDPAAVRARLVLASILEGSLGRAREELAEFVRLHPEARGRFGGRETVYAEALGALLAESDGWPKPPPEPDWLTLGGNPARNQTAAVAPDVGPVAWRQALPAVEPGGQLGAVGVAEQVPSPLSYHPVLWNDLVLVNNATQIRALRAADGRPAWESESPVIFEWRESGALGELIGRSETMGTPRFTMSVHDGRLYARMGSTVTGRPVEVPAAIRPGCLVCLDLHSEGRLLWTAQPEKGWAFEGSPVADAAGVYVAMRRNDVRPQAHVACFDPQTGRMIWRRFVCAAETPARGIFYQCTSNLLTLVGERIYVNTNLGAVAALRRDDGRLLWVSLYPRARQGDVTKLAPHWVRDLNPCVYDRGTLLVAPADSPRIFAIDAASGRTLWQTGPEVEDVVHLLGTAGERLVASGRRLYWIGLDRENQGRVAHVWPEAAESLGYGRGVLAAGRVLWPSRERIYTFEAETARPLGPIELAPHGAGGGNLLAAGDKLLVATHDGLVALGAGRGAAEPAPAELTQRAGLEE